LVLNNLYKPESKKEKSIFMGYGAIAKCWPCKACTVVLEEKWIEPIFFICFIAKGFFLCFYVYVCFSFQLDGKKGSFDRSVLFHDEIFVLANQKIE
jgi:hypothetical protein